MSAHTVIRALLQEGTSTLRSPYFNRRYYTHWKVRMEDFIKSYAVKGWQVIKKTGFPLLQSKLENKLEGNISTETLYIVDYTDEHMTIVQINSKAKNLLYNAISGEEFEKISSCDTAKEMWDKLEVTYEGTGKVKETRINFLIHDYELFQMKDDESIEDIPYSSGEQVSKILRSLPTLWQLKVITLEYGDLDKLSYDELRGDLIPFEQIHLKKNGHEENKKNVACKSTIAKSKGEDEEEGDKHQDDIALFSRVVSNTTRRSKNNRRGKSSSRKGNEISEQKNSDRKCYECRNYGRIQANCPELKRKLSKGNQKRKSSIVWSDEYMPDKDHSGAANLCFEVKQVIKENLLVPGVMKIYQTTIMRNLQPTASWPQVKQVVEYYNPVFLFTAQFILYSHFMTYQVYLGGYSMSKFLFLIK
ncbi:uncharacterized protein [Nicotiana tomentosiformis]|uniref:uncharacterized protein n=1 Tax=Nicotiana tomentosiformis TaxID=4098 RepID=UPI00388C7886